MSGPTRTGSACWTSCAICVEASRCPGYDALGVEEILAVLGEADLATIKKVRAYERKFANRPDVLEEVVRVHHRWRETHPRPPRPLTSR